MIRKICLTLTATAAVIFLAIGVCAGAETLDDYINNVILVHQRYDIANNVMYEQSHHSEYEVNPQTGEFSMRQTDYKLPGKNGLDVEITRIYRSGQMYDKEVYIVGGNTIVTQVLLSPGPYSFWDMHYSLGADMRFSFPAIQISGDHLYLHTESGAVYPLERNNIQDGITIYRLDGREVKGMFVEKSSTGSYLLKEKDGKKTYFDNMGFVTKIEDRYNNKITFEYENWARTWSWYDHSDYIDVWTDANGVVHYTPVTPHVVEEVLSYTATKQLKKIIDTAGREILFHYAYAPISGSFSDFEGNGGYMNHMMDITIATPDGQKITYEKYNNAYDHEYGWSARERIHKVYHNYNAAQNPAGLGDLKYFYWYERSVAKYAANENDSYKVYGQNVDIYNSDMRNVYNINFIAEAETNKAKKVVYQDVDKRLGQSGKQQFRNVTSMTDISLDTTTSEGAGYTYAFWEPSVTLTGQPRTEKSETYTYPIVDPSMDKKIFEQNFDWLPSGSGLTTLPGITNVSGWYMSAAADRHDESGNATRFGISLSSSSNAPNVQTLTIQALDASWNGETVREVVFDAKRTGTWSENLDIVFSDGTVITKELTDHWVEYVIAIPGHVTTVTFRANKPPASSNYIYIDNIIVDHSHIVSKRVDDVYYHYFYSPGHMLIKDTQGYGAQATYYAYFDYNVIENVREYDDRKLLSKMTTTTGMMWYREDSYEQEGCRVAQVQEYTYDDYGDILTYKGPDYPGAVVKYTYGGDDRYHKLTSRIVRRASDNAELTETIYDVDAKGNTTREVRYNANGVNSAITDLTYDDQGNITSKKTYSANVEVNGTVVSVPSIGEEYKTVMYYEYGAFDGISGNSGSGFGGSGLYLTREYSKDASNNLLYDKRYNYNLKTGLLYTSANYQTASYPNVTTYLYDHNNRLDTVIYPDSASDKYRYEDKGISDAGNYELQKNSVIQIIKQNPQGTIEQHLSYAYDILDRLIAVVPTGNEWEIDKYAYDAFGNLKLHIANGKQELYIYDELNRLIARKVLDGAGNEDTLTIDYRGSDRPFISEAVQRVRVTDEAGNVTTRYLDNVGRVRAIEVDPGGAELYLKRYGYDELGNKVSESEYLAYTKDSSGSITGVAEAQSNTTFAYDKLGRLIKKTGPLGDTVDYAYNAVDKVTQVNHSGTVSNYEYDAVGQIKRESTDVSYYYNTFDSVNPTALVSYVKYKEYQYDLMGNLTRVQGSDGRDVIMRYNNRGHIVNKSEHIDGTRYGETGGYEYDALGNCTCKIVYTNRTGKNEGKIQTNTLYDQLGRQIMETVTAVYSRFDANGNEIQEDNTRGIMKTKYIYGSGQNIWRLDKVLRYDSAEDALITNYVYDYAGRVSEVRTPTGSGDDQNITRFSYYKNGYQSSKTIVKDGIELTEYYHYNALGNMTAKTNALGETTRYAYDADGNKIAEVDARQHATTQMSHAAVIAASGIHYEYDALGRLTKQKLHEEDGSDTVIAVKEYDKHGNVTKVMDGEGCSVNKGMRMEYDALDNLIAVYTVQSYELSGIPTKRMLYDSNGHITAAIEYENNGNETLIYPTLYQYNADSSLKQVITPDGKVTAYEYDDTGRLFTQITEYKNGQYDTTKRKTSIYTNLFGAPYRTEYPDDTTTSVNYDMYLGLALVITDQKNRQSRRKYNRAGNMTEKEELIKTDGSDSYYRIYKYDYNEWGKVISESVCEELRNAGGVSTLASHTLRTIHYDSLMRADIVTGANEQETQYIYDAAGNIATSKIKVSDGYYDITRYDYDTLGRLSSETVFVDPEHLLDPTGYETDDSFPGYVMLTTAYEYYNNANVKNITDPRGIMISYEYDKDGKISKEIRPSENITSYTYDLRGNVKTQTNSAGMYERYEYDGMGRMVKKSTNPLDITSSERIWVYTYDHNGNLISEQTPSLHANNAALTYAYDKMNRRTAAYDADGKLIEAVKYDNVGNIIKKADGLHCTSLDALETSVGDTFVYDGLNRIIGKKDARNNETGFEYDILGNITKQTDANNHSTTYFYNPDSTLREVKTPDEGNVTYVYDKKGRVTSQTVKQSDTVSLTTTYTYTATDKVYIETDAEGHTNTYKYDANGNVVKITDKRDNTTSFEYDGNGRITVKKVQMSADMYNVEKYEYDTAGNVTKKTIEGDGYTDRTVSYQYMPGGQLKCQSANGGSVIDYFYDASGNLGRTETLRSDGENSYTDVMTFTYDKYDRKLTETKHLSGQYTIFGADAAVTTAYTYNLLGMVETMTDPRGDVTTYEYDTLNRIEYVKRIYNGQEVKTSYAYDAVGNTLSIIDEANHETSYTYDTMNRIKTVVDAKGVKQQDIVYDYAGNKVAESLPNGIYYNYKYDHMNRPVKTWMSGSLTLSVEYDANGNVTKTTDGNGHSTSYAYNAANMVTVVTLPEGQTTTYAYNRLGDKISVTNALSQTTSYEYDRHGRIIKVTDPTGAFTKFTYDTSGNQTSMTDANEHKTTYEYGSFGIISRIIDENKNVQSYKYDRAMQLISSVDRNGITTAYSYDNRGRLTSKNAGMEAVSYAYDVMGNRTGMTDTSGVYAYVYDALSHVISTSKDDVDQVSYAYDDIGNVKAMTYAGGTTVTYTYDNKNRLRTVSGGGVSATYDYDAAGNVTLAGTTAGISTAYTYNDNNQVESICHTTPSSSSVTTYAYDAAGRQRSKTVDNRVTAYTYDAAGRISEVEMPDGTSLSYSYDRAGNRRLLTEISTSAKEYYDAVANEKVQYKKKITEYSYSPVNTLDFMKETMYNESAKMLSKETSYSYDLNGNLYSSVSTTVRIAWTEAGVSIGDSSDVAIEMVRNEYDVWNNLAKTAVTSGGKVVETSYTYDGDGMRQSKRVVSDTETKTTTYTYSGAYVIAETTESGTVKYVRGLSYIAKVGVSNDVHYYQYNAHGDVVQVVGSNGMVENRYEYDIFGSEISADETVENSIKYAGEFYDASAGLYYLRARYYDPVTARFTTEDTYRGMSENPASLNLYTYCYNDPIQHTDPSGHEPPYPWGYGPPPPTLLEKYGSTGGPADEDSFNRWLISQGIDPTYQAGGTTHTIDGYGGMTPIQLDNVRTALSTYISGKTDMDTMVDTVKRNGGSLNDMHIVAKSSGDVPKLVYKLSTMSSRERRYAEGILMDAYDNDSGLLTGIMKYYVDQQGGMGAARRQQDSDQPIEAFESIYASGPNNRNPAFGPKDMFDDYGFGLFDALNRLIQTGGDVDYILQTRTTVDIDVAAAKQANIIKSFIVATDLLRTAGQDVRTPGFYIGSLETITDIHSDDVDILTGQAMPVYKKVMSLLEGDAAVQKTVRKSGDKNMVDAMIAGIYLGVEDSKKMEAAKSLRDELKGMDQSKKLIWIPYIGPDEDGTIPLKRLNAIKGIAEQGIFDYLLIQPGAFFWGDSVMNEDTKEGLLTAILQLAYDQKQSNGHTKVGIQVEFDTSLIAGRAGGNYEMDPGRKKFWFDKYLEALQESIENGIPFGAYSGGPNEQGYNNITSNSNTLNFGSYVPYEGGHTNGVQIDRLGAYPGNLIYDINTFIYTGVWDPRLGNPGFGLTNPAKSGFSRRIQKQEGQ